MNETNDQDAGPGTPPLPRNQELGAATQMASIKTYPPGTPAMSEAQTVPIEIVPTADLHVNVLRPHRLETRDAATCPLIREWPLRRLNALYYLPRARARTGLVITTPRSGPIPVGPTGRPAKAEIFWGGGTLYEVDLGLHHTTAEIELPSQVDLIMFAATAEIEWRVVDSAQVVGDNIRDVRKALTPLLRCRLRDITRNYPTTDLSAAEEAVSKEVEDWDPGERYGLETRIVLRLAADKQSAEHAAARLKLQQQIEIEGLEHQLKDLVDRHERDRQRARLEVYRAIIAAGNVEQFALQLASNPEDVRTVMSLAREERNEERRQITDFLTNLLSSGAIDRWDIEDQVREALAWLAESTHRTVQTGEYSARWSPPPSSNGATSGNTQNKDSSG